MSDDGLSAEQLNQIGEILPYLSPSQPSLVRKTALDILEPFGSELSAIKLLHEQNILVNIVRMLCDDDILAQIALRLLVNISSLDEGRMWMIEDTHSVERCLDALKDREQQNRHKLTLMLLANLTKEKEACKIVLQTDTPLQGLAVLRLLKMFARSQHEGESDDYAHIADVLTNISQTETGRNILLDEKRGIMPLIVQQISSQNQIRSLGALRTIRNCAYEHTKHCVLLDEQLGLITVLLKALAGPEPLKSEDMVGMLPSVISALHINKVREKNTEVRHLMCEVFDMLARVKSSRMYLKRIQIYPILRELHLFEENEQELDYIEDLVQWFLSEESVDAKIPLESVDNGTQNDDRIQDITDTLETTMV